MSESQENPSKAPMHVSGWSKTDIGNVRKNNEDSHLLDLEHALFVVADGVGGSPAGEVASQHFCAHMQASAAELNELVSRGDTSNDRDHRERVFGRLFRLIQEANSKIFEIGKEINPTAPSATTADVMLISGFAAYIAHVGDSRVYLIRDGQVFRITEDHTFAEQIRKEVDDPQMVERYKNVLTRSIGGRPQVDIDALFIDLKPDDRVLMCSDGLTDYLTGSEILEFALRYNADELIDKLIDEAKERGGADNITALLVEVEGDMDVRRTGSFDTLKQVDILGQISLFQDLDLRELIRVLRVVYELPFKDGEVISTQGEAADCLYIVAEGEVATTQSGRESTLAQGEHFGATALILDTPRRKTAVAKGDALLLVVPAERFRELVVEDPILGNKLLWNLLYRAAEQIVSADTHDE